MEIYGAAVADKLDNGRNILRRRYYRQHCTPDFGSYTKDLTAICNDLNRVRMIDSSLTTRLKKQLTNRKRQHAKNEIISFVFADIYNR